MKVKDFCNFTILVAALQQSIKAKPYYEDPNGNTVCDKPRGTFKNPDSINTRPDYIMIGNRMVKTNEHPGYRGSSRPKKILRKNRERPQGPGVKSFGRLTPVIGRSNTRKNQSRPPLPRSKLKTEPMN